MENKKSFGTAPVFFTAISTILGAILFLRFGWAVGMLGFVGASLVIILGQIVSVPTALSVSEIATNKKVEGGGIYYIISRSFGLDIGATIGIFLFLSQAISVAFYVIACTQVIGLFYPDFPQLIKMIISLLLLAGVTWLIWKKGAKIGISLLYIVVAALAVSLICFFLGKPVEGDNTIDFLAFTDTHKANFFEVFAVCFPAFTGLAAGVGLSGDLKNPSRSIPWGTMLAVIVGMLVYLMVVYKFFVSAPLSMLADPDNELIISDISLAGKLMVPLGLVASTLSSAIGSILVAPRTLQALGIDKSLFSLKMNTFFAKGVGEENEPINAMLFTSMIAAVFIVMGDINSVATIITMFFLVTYGSVCLISFLNHFGADPSYRPSFKSTWYVSLGGFICCFWLMFKIDFTYAMFAFISMGMLYVFISKKGREKRPIAYIFVGVLMQLNRTIHIYLQKLQRRSVEAFWRPSVISISDKPIDQSQSFNVLHWLSYAKGFGTYLYFEEGVLNMETKESAHKKLEQMVTQNDSLKYNIYIDTIISPSFTSALAQAVQLPGIAGMDNNMVLFEVEQDTENTINRILNNFHLIDTAGFDCCVYRKNKEDGSPLKKDIHVWLKNLSSKNSNMMILLSCIIGGAKHFKNSRIKLFTISDNVEETKRELLELTRKGRIPVYKDNIIILPHEEGLDYRDEINENSKIAKLTIVGFSKKGIEQRGSNVFLGLEDVSSVLFVASNSHKDIE